MKSYIKYFVGLILFSFMVRMFSFPSEGTTVLKSIKVFLSPLVDAYLLAFQDPNTALLLFLSIFVVCFICIYWIYFNKYLPLSNALDISLEKTKLIQEVIKSREASPLEALNELENDNILKKSIFKLKRIIFSADAKNIPSKYNFLTLDIIETNGFPLKIISALPGYFVGFGVVCTFLGLVAALYFSAQGMKSGNYDAAKVSLMHLLYASSFKFTTSIAGISSSLLISILYKSLLHKLHLKISRLQDMLENICESIHETPVKKKSAR